MSNTILTQT